MRRQRTDGRNSLGPSGEVAATHRHPEPFHRARRRLAQLAAVTIKTRAAAQDAGARRRSGSSGPGPARRRSWSRPRRTNSCRLPRGIDAPELDAARRVATALESSRTDIPFRNALPIALWLLEADEILIRSSLRFSPAAAVVGGAFV